MSPTRDAEAAKGFFLKVLHSPSASAPQAHTMKEQLAQPSVVVKPTTPTPGVITVDKNAAYPQAIADRKARGALPAADEL